MHIVLRQAIGNLEEKGERLGGPWLCMQLLCVTVQGVAGLFAQYAIDCRVNHCLCCTNTRLIQGVGIPGGHFWQTGMLANRQTALPRPWLRAYGRPLDNA
jgi:hypothetical protein